MRRLKWSKSAQNDLARIDDWYADIDPEIADRIGKAAIRASRFLIDVPYAGPALADSDLRKWNVPKSSYRLIYRVTETDIEIISVRHARENWRDE